MAGKFFKWFFAVAFTGIFCSAAYHPIFVSVTEIEHNLKENSLEISCKLFTDDFEKALRKAHNAKVDLINPKDKAGMDKLVNAYIQTHLKISVDGKLVALKFLGYEVVEEGVYSYFEANGVNQMKTVNIFNNLLYEYKAEQMGLVHVLQKGIRKSTKLMNPTDKATIVF